MKIYNLTHDVAWVGMDYTATHATLQGAIDTYMAYPAAPFDEDDYLKGFHPTKGGGYARCEIEEEWTIGEDQARVDCKGGNCSVYIYATEVGP